MAARSIMYALHRLVQTQTTAWAHARINQRLSELNPEEIADPQVQARGRDAREAILEGRAQLQATSAVSVVSAAVIALSLCFTLGATSWPAALCVCACLIPMTVSNMWYARKDGGMWPRISESRRRATYYENQITYQGTATELATLEARGWVAGRANKYRYQGRAGETQLGMLGIYADAAAGIASSLFVIAALAFLVHSGASAARLSGAIVGIFSGISATSSLGFTVGSLMSGRNAIARVVGFLRPGENTYSKPRLLAHQEIGSVTVENLVVRYANAARPAVVGASVRARTGQMIALVGPNGAGKSTFIRGLLGLLPVESGRVVIDDRDVTELPFSARRSGISLLTQEFGRYEFTVRENLMLGITGQPATQTPRATATSATTVSATAVGTTTEGGTAESSAAARDAAVTTARVTDEQLWHALEVAKAADFVRALPQGLDSQLGEQWGGTGLSGGQWQRLALARLILRNDPVWILDEPTSSIDAEAEEQIFQELAELTAEHIIIVVSHRAWTLRHADQIYVFDEGKIVEHGTFAQLAGSKSRFRELFNEQGVTKKADAKKVADR
ncbi:ATP-binding cassette domain-containing protein [Actinobaculum suis]|uniref:ATP-binding cassette domain-containing protein n=1 Tax=Actinobaculum suis TaxID=1657 RepID=UPI0012E1E443|nr:ABC transporter ATP-binding protein [Actinobaculum suis]